VAAVEFPETRILSSRSAKVSARRARKMADDRSAEDYRRLATQWLAVAHGTSDIKERASLVKIALRWLDLAERAERGAWSQSLRRHAVAAIGDELRKLYPLSDHLPLRLLLLLAQLKQKNGPPTI
jgi:hypothetical protein